MIKVIIFDFDGVILDSLQIKTDAYAEFYRPFGYNIVNKVINHHTLNGGMSRYDKISFYHKKFLNKNINKYELNSLCKKFSSMVKSKVYKAKFFEGSKEFIKLNYKKYKMFISSGTPTFELISICKRKKIDKFFIEIFGSPNSKEYHIKKILLDYKIKNYEIIFIGDSNNDYKAAVKNKLKFVAFGNNVKIHKSKKNIKIFNFSELNNAIKILN